MLFIFILARELKLQLLSTLCKFSFAMEVKFYFLKMFDMKKIPEYLKFPLEKPFRF